jgi:predicted dehydrogenase
MKIAIIGRGFGAYAMAPAYQRLGCVVEIVAARDAMAIAAACKTADLVSIHSPPFQHHDHVMMALDAGKPVLCDKPFGRNAVEAKSMRDAAKAAGVLHFLNFEFRAQPTWAKARAMIEEGAIGTLTHISWTNYGNGMRGRPHGWLYEAEQGGGWIGAYGAHVIDGLRFFYGTDADDCGGMVRTETASRPDDAGTMHPSTAEDSFSLWFRMKNGGTASVDSGYAAPVALPPVLYLMGSDAAISIHSDTLLTLIKPDSSQPFDLSAELGGIAFPALPLWLGQVLAAVQSGKQIEPNFDDGVAVALTIGQLKMNAHRAA